jgi:anaerobic magnesium-protoporphyrin IX monomethyl ester cyclase
MAEIVLTHSYMLRFDPKQKRIGQPWAPLGTLYAASVLKEGGHSVCFHDPMFLHQPDEIIPALEQEKPAILVIYDDGFSYLTKMCLDNMRKVALRMAELGHQRGVRVIISSSDASDNYAYYLGNNTDFVILGEGELTLKDLVARILSGRESSLAEVRGMAYMREGAVILTEKRALISEPDILPFPAWDLLDAESYRRIWRAKNGHFALNMVTTRGCPFNCIWCAKPIYGNHYNNRSPQNVVEEMLYLQDTLKPDRLWFADDIFGLSPGWLEEFAGLVAKYQIQLPFSIQSRVDLLLSDSQVASLAEAGCTKIWLGIESGSQKILDAMRKGITLEQIRAVSPKLRQAGIEQAFFIQLGFPGETREDIARTIRLLLELMPDDIGISVSYPLPGTEFYNSVKSTIDEKSHWKDSDDLAMLYKGTFSPHYYKILHRYIHKYFRYKQAVFYLKMIFTGHLKLTYSRLRRMVLLPYYFIFFMAYKSLLKTR